MRMHVFFIFTNCGGLNFHQKAKTSVIFRVEAAKRPLSLSLISPCFSLYLALLSSPPPHTNRSHRGRLGWSSRLLWVLPAPGACVRVCLSGLWSRRSPGTQPGVLGTFPLLSSFNYGPIMKAARSAATHHTLKEEKEGDPTLRLVLTSHLCSPSTCLLSVMLIPLFGLCSPTSVFLLGIFSCISETFLYAFSVFHLSVCFFFDLSLCLLYCAVSPYESSLFQLFLSKALSFLSVF